MPDRAPILPPLRRTAADAEAFARVDELLGNLGRLKHGWASTDSLAPTGAVMRDLTEASSLLAEIGGDPTAEVDDSDGSVTIVWEPEARAGCIVFNGNGKAIALASGEAATILLTNASRPASPALEMLRAAVERGAGRDG